MDQLCDLGRRLAGLESRRVSGGKELVVCESPSLGCLVERC
jgi:hypothetical protein